MVYHYALNLVRIELEAPRKQMKNIEYFSIYLSRYSDMVRKYFIQTCNGIVMRGS